MFVDRLAPHLRVPGADEGFLLREIHLDAPTPEVVLERLGNRQLRVHAQDVCGLPIEQFAGFAQPVAQRRDDDDAQFLVRPGFAPQLLRPAGVVPRSVLKCASV